MAHHQHPKKPPPPAPTKPTQVNPFMNANDLDAFNQFMTAFSSNLANIDFSLGDLRSDTAYQKRQANTAATEQTAATQDAMAARGLFKSSIKDASLYDIEAQRSLANKFLDDKLTAATLNAGTQKKLLGDSKKRFDEAMLKHKADNAAAVNDPANAAWAELMAAWQKKYGKPAAPKPGQPTTPKPTTHVHEGDVFAPRTPRTNYTTYTMGGPPKYHSPLGTFVVKTRSASRLGNVHSGSGSTRGH